MVNCDLKAQIEELRLERQQLMVMLNLHRPTCIVRTDSVKTPESEANPLLEQLSAGAKWNQETRGRRVPDAPQTGGTVGVLWKANWRYISRQALELQAEDFWRLCPKTWGRTASSALLHELALSIGRLALPSFISTSSVVVDTRCASLLLQPSLRKRDQWEQ